MNIYVCMYRETVLLFGTVMWSVCTRRWYALCTVESWNWKFVDMNAILVLLLYTWCTHYCSHLYVQKHIIFFFAGSLCFFKTIWPKVHTHIYIHTCILPYILLFLLDCLWFHELVHYFDFLIRGTVCTLIHTFIHTYIHTDLAAFSTTISSIIPQLTYTCYPNL